jgi:hypothetical protein
MMRTYLIAMGAAAALAGGCGDNSKQCDPGTTMDVDGVCKGTATTCSDGTMLVDGVCVIDPNACQDGTVLVGGQCVDPGHVTADVEEAAEPNGFGLLGETSTAPAGQIMLKPAGQHFVIHGTIEPFRDADGDGQLDADVDTYVIDVSTPVMLSVSVDGLHGLAGGFVSVANVASTHPLASWTRFGINPLGDASKRQLYLPVAGTYVIAIADTRSLTLSGAAVGAEEGKPTLEYYVSIEQVPATATALTATDGVATSSGTLNPGEVKLFSVAMGEGVNNAGLAMSVDHVRESVVVANTHSGVTSIKAVANGASGDGDIASAAVVGIRSGDSQIVVVDSVFDYANAPYDYDLEVTVGGAAALPTGGTSVTQPASTTEFSTFYYDVGADGRLVGMDILFDRPVSGAIVDEDFSIFSAFTFHPFFGFNGTFQTYKGLLNHAAAGRYYFIVFDPTGAASTIQATSTYEGLQPATLAFDTTVNAEPLNDYGSAVYTYASPAASPWQQFAAQGVGTGNITISYYRPSTAFGRLDPLASTCGAGCNDSPAPIFAHVYPAASATYGRIMLDDLTASYLVKVRTQTGTGTFDHLISERPFTDLGTVNVGTPVTETDVPLEGQAQRFLVRTGGGNGLTITVHPDVGTLDTRIVHLGRDEGVLADVSTGAAGLDDTHQVIQGGSGWTAFEVTSAAPELGDAFDVTVTATAATTYTRSTGTTAFSDACSGGTVVPMTDSDEGRSAATIATPAGFDFFGFAAPQLRVFSNGFLTFDTALDCATTGFNCFYGNADIPATATPNALVAPYWDDLDLEVADGVCQKTDGTKLIIQWNGIVFGGTTAVLFQAILDGANDTIEFVYDSTHAANGSGATIGIENQVGGAASKVGFNTANSVAPTLFTPN